MSGDSKKFYRYILLLVVVLFGSLTIISSGGGDDDNDDGGDSGTYSVSGYVQKGPFISGSAITIQELDDELEPTGASYQTTTTDDFGTFSLGSQIDSSYVEVIATGFYFNEISGYLSNANLTLRAIVDLSTQEDVNVNVLTTLEKDRIKYLISNEGLIFTEARTQAEEEILAIFNIHEDIISSFSRMDISQEGDGNAILLAVSAILLSGNVIGEESESSAELSEFISKINLDIEEDGTLDDASCIEGLNNKVMNLNLYIIKENLANRYEDLGSSITPPDFEDFIDSDNDGTINIDDDDITNYAPENVEAFAGHQKVKITWDAMSEAVSYNIYWTTSSGVSKTNYDGVIEYDAVVRVGGEIDPGGPPPMAAGFATSSSYAQDIVANEVVVAFVDAPTAYTHEGLTNGMTYYYVITGVNTGGWESLESEEVYATPSPAEGTPDNPFYIGQIFIDIAVSGSEDYYGHVDNTASYYRVDSVPGAWWIYLNDLTDDVDLYVYEDSGFSVLLNSSTNSGTETEACDLMGDDGTRYIKVSGSNITSVGANFTVDIQP